MRQYLADLHIHSRFSRATSRNLTLPLLAAWGALKGLAVIGTGDFTHPAWRAEMADLLRPGEASGLYCLKDERLIAEALPELPVAKALRPDGAREGLAPRFMLQAEISSIYKRGGKVRKVHNLVYMPTLEAAGAFSAKLADIGNIASDGRPILGLDSRDLLEMVLEADPRAFLVPAHIWTPWFSVFGSKSGFDSLEDCFGDLTPEIFALETGLSSDPAMNRLWSRLDGCRLISNSDAHSGEKLGREANVFAGAMSYDGMLAALKSPDGAAGSRFLGTVEFFPEEGKYHMDGHRACKVRLTPAETRACGGICPVCGKPLTVGVCNRVMELADRDEPVYQPGDGTGQDSPPSPLGPGGFVSLVPLPEVIGEILGVGPATRRVRDMYVKALERFGPELDILRATPAGDLARLFPPLGEAISRMRAGRVILMGGYDGEYGTVRMFSDEERTELLRGTALPGTGKRRGRPKKVRPGLLGGDAEEPGEPEKAPAPAPDGSAPDGGGVAPVPGSDAADDFDFSEEPEDGELSAALTAAFAQPPAEASRLNPEQERAVLAGPGPVLTLAGPGTGKTRTLIARILHLLDEGIASRRMAAVTFTRHAAAEMDARLTAALGKNVTLPRTDTLHALALEVWRRATEDAPMLLSEDNARRVFAEASPGLPAAELADAWDALCLARERRESPGADLAGMAERYRAHKNAWNLADYTDLLEFWLEQIQAGLWKSPWSHVLVDEVQDLSPLQLELVRALVGESGEGFFGIGDPDQAIYGFRGAHGDAAAFFRAAWPGLDIIPLERNYRSLPEMLIASAPFSTLPRPLLAQRREKAVMHLFSAPSAEAEAVWIASRVAALIGAGSHTIADADGLGPLPEARGDHSPGEIALLLRASALAPVYRKALARHNLPVSEPARDAFWKDERVALILRAAGRMLGIAPSDDVFAHQSQMPPCPDKALMRGPLGVIAYLDSSPGFDETFSHSRAFRNLVRAYEDNRGWAGLLTFVGLQNERELARARGEKVQILTIHAAKGLEFRSVFLPALEDGLMPFAGPGFLSGKAAGLEANPDEERRLFYVALTRARDALYLTYAARRTLFGRELRLRPSRFLDRLEGFSRSALVAQTNRRAEQLKLF